MKDPTFDRGSMALFGDGYIEDQLQSGAIVQVEGDRYLPAELLDRSLSSGDIIKAIGPNGEYYIRKSTAAKADARQGYTQIENVLVENGMVPAMLEDGRIVKCDDCGKLHFPSSLTMTSTGARACPRCLGRKYRKCDECGEYHPSALVSEIEGRDLCVFCRDRLCVYCEHCMTWHPAERRSEFAQVAVSANGTQLWCPSCIEANAVRCESCGSLVSSSIVVAADGRTLCPSCRSAYNESIENPIHQYAYHPTPSFIDIERRSRYADDKLYYGVELETDCGNGMDFARELSVFNQLYCKRDGSLGGNGVEIVTHPMTMEYHTQSDLWQKVSDIATRFGMKSHDTMTCGLHIHISRKPFIESGVEDYDAKLALAFSKFWAEWKKFSRRKGDSISRWADRYCGNTLMEIKNDIEDAGYDRYRCVNMCNRNTLEVRIFRGTLKVETIKATIWAVANLSERILDGFNPEDANSFLELFDMQNAPQYFLDYMTVKGFYGEQLCA